MEAIVDPAGRILVPRKLRTALGLTPGTKVDISAYGAGVQVIPESRSAPLVEEDGRLVVAGTTVLTDELMYALMDEGRK